MFVLSAVGVLAAFIAQGGNLVGWWGMRPAVLGAIYLVAALLVFLDVFVRPGGPFGPWWRRGGPPGAPPAA